MSEIKILIVEDEKELSDFLAAVLNKEGYRTVRAFDGEEGFRLAESESPALAVLDIMMPKVHGFDLCQKLRGDERFKDLKIVISTAKRYPADERAARELGADAYLMKPYDVDLLLKTVKDLLG